MKVIKIIISTLTVLFFSLNSIYAENFTTPDRYVCESRTAHMFFSMWTNSQFTQTPNYSQIDDVSIYHNGAWHSQGNTMGSISYNAYPGQHSITVQFKKTNFWGANDYYYVKFIIIRNDGVLDLPLSICQGETIDLNDFTNNNRGTFSCSDSLFLTGVNYDELSIPLGTTPSTLTVTWFSTTVEGCPYEMQSNIEIREKPTLSWVSNIQTGTILTTDPAIQLPPYVTSSDIITFEGNAVVGSEFRPNFTYNGAASDVFAIATNPYGCTDTIMQQITVIYNGGTPNAPERFSEHSTGHRTIEVYGDEETESAFDLCDGQEFQFRLAGNGGVQQTAVYYYVSNGITDTIGEFNKSTLVSYTIPQTGVTRTDYIYGAYVSSIGEEGPFISSPVYVNTTSPQENQTICVTGSEVINIDYTTSGINQTSVNLSYNDLQGTIVSLSHSLQTSPILDSLKLRETRNYIWKDLNNNIIDTTYNYNYNNIGNKLTTLIREEFTILPFYFEDSLSYFYNPLPQTCRKIDTIKIVQNPIVDYIYSGNPVIIGGTTVTIDDNSLLSDYTTFNFYNGKDEQQGTSITDTLYSGQGTVLITAYDNYGCKDDTLVNLVLVTDDPGVGLLDVQNTSGVIYPIENGLISISGLTDTINSELHVCDGQQIHLQIDTNKLDFNYGIDSVRYIYYSNGTYDTIGKFEVSEIVSYNILQTNNKRVDSVFTELFTILDYSGKEIASPVYVSYSFESNPTTQILKCTENLNYTDFIGQQTQDYDGLMNWSHQGINADFTTFETVFKDVYGQILFNSGNLFTHSLSSVEKSDTIYKKEITNLPFKNSGNNTYYNAIVNPQTCEYFDTIIIVRPPIASYTYQGTNQIIAGTSVKHISTSQFSDWVEWDFNDGSDIYTGDTMWHSIYDIGDNDITVMAYDIYGCADTLHDVGYINVTDWTGVEDNQKLITNVLSYPNPVNDQLTLKIKANENVETDIIIYDYSGRKVLSQKASLVASENIININVTKLSSGIYNCQIVGNNINVSQKLIKQ